MQQTVAGEVEGVDLDLGVLPGMDEADVRFDTMASISSRLSLGTITISACAGVTTPPTVWIASCCTVPSTGARQYLQPGPLLGLDRGPSASRAAFCSASASSSDSARRYSAAACSRVLADRWRCGRFGLAHWRLLDDELLLLLDQVS